MSAFGILLTVYLVVIAIGIAAMIGVARHFGPDWSEIFWALIWLAFWPVIVAFILGGCALTLIGEAVRWLGIRLP